MAKNEFFDTMQELGYVLDKKEGLKLTYIKERTVSSLLLVIDFAKKYVNPALRPKILIMYEVEMTRALSEFNELMQDAEYIAKRAGYEILGGKR